jgi:predicted RNase H-like HicB family nuclease
MKKAELTIIVQKDKESGWLVGQLEEFPSVISQGENIDELKENLKDALKLVLEYQKDDLTKKYLKEKVIKRKMQFD